MQIVIAVGLLVAVLGFAVARPAGLPEAVAAVPAAALAVLAGLVPLGAAWRDVVELAPTVGFLAAVLLLAHLADAHGVFRYAAAVAARAGAGRPVRLLGAVFAVAASVTAVLSLDATVVLLTPVVFATAARLEVRARPHVYACTHLANSASLLLPVSNLTNLLAFAASGLGFAAFAGLMALPWLAVLAVEWVVFRLFFAADLTVPAGPAPPLSARPPRYALAVLGLTVLGFPFAEPLGVHPALVAAAGALLLAVPRVRRVPKEAVSLLRELDPAFCAFVFALSVVVLAVRRHGLDALAAAWTPARATFAGLLLTAFLAALLSNVINNVPATLVLVPAAAHSPGLLLAVLIGVNVGPNLTYVGSLATLLWRQILHRHDAAPSTREFLALGALSVPACLLAGVAALWAVLEMSGVS
ncbi:arsenic transporter [Virgisporangium aliadipatigenens]|uniref:Arsenic transporter n=1 Tax=Virgisporangium aliadipatigenens TaxID=741659 RepID=A0A8J4DQ20_9ACTN|nr:ArsB/NhaD family transporter [Virgisporangium aliadipatigenens]GIJ45253.1 arsenic transporter [Virgisporangium aliadipatigenens]